MKYCNKKMDKTTLLHPFQLTNGQRGTGFACDRLRISRFDGPLKSEIDYLTRKKPNLL